MRATEVRSDSGLRPRASWDHHCSARWLTVREARAPELLKGAALALVDPGTTAAWEMRLDEVVTGRVQFKGVIDEIAAEAAKLIAVLRQHTGALVDLSRPAPIAGRRSRGRARAQRNADKAATDTSGSIRPKAKSQRSRKAKAATAARRAPARAPAETSPPPTARMVAFAEKLAKEKGVGLPAGYARDFEICRRFLDDHAQR